MASLPAGVILAIIVPALVAAFLLGDLESDLDCDAFCHTNTGGLIFGLITMPRWTVPVAVAGGVVSAIASHIGVRPARAA